MGTCFGHCFDSSSRRHDRCHSLYACKTEYVQFDQNPKPVEENQGEVPLELTENSWSLQICDRYIAQACVPYRHYLEPSLPPSDREFHTLDAKALLVPQTYTACFSQENKSLHSTPPSSIDLEWEHETPFQARTFHDDDDSDSIANSVNNNMKYRPYYKSLQAHKIRVGSRQGSITQESSNTSKEGSRMTTPDSLEWDFVEPSITNIDQETEQLIAEIERLAASALEETGNYDFNVVDDTGSTHEKL
ncbi:Histidine-containing phosphotransfer protein 3 [Frankliniella fusca]|uniref:Histidine-containing phosphotransfer protein 3 n=1 Tax=Frankliniella fusca TaxID=407009 RepID=A0AAE1HQ09_9NEOP|nr:Histidine-containing phosphotransfer protein 3 [Frankliniella fusca]